MISLEKKRWNGQLANEENAALSMNFLKYKFYNIETLLSPLRLKKVNIQCC